MTRSVEIPEETVEKAHAAWLAKITEHGLPRDAVRAALAAALPYLVPAGFDGHEPDDCRWPDTLGRCPHSAERRAAGTEIAVRPRPGDLEAAITPHAPIPSGERVSACGPERCDLCGLSWGSPMHDEERRHG